MSSTPGITTAHQFKKLLLSEQLEFICEAHNGLSAKIVQEAGFRGIWASGLSISAQFGVRDNNEASWTQKILRCLEFMSDATTIPILLDGDTGYGNFNNMQRLVRKLEQRHIAAVCIEDKLFPQTNSFIKGGAQPLADMQEFCGKIKAAKTRRPIRIFASSPEWRPSFAAGDWWFVRRADAYHQAGADGILIHSALSVPDEILAFKQEWGNRCPVVIVPTKYYATPTDVFRQHGFSMVIWANHMLRAAVAAMQKTARTLKEQEHLLSIEDKVAPVSEIFRLQNAAELQEAEDRYLPRSAEDTCAIVLAASRGDELGELTEQQPKISEPTWRCTRPSRSRSRSPSTGPSRTDTAPSDWRWWVSCGGRSSRASWCCTTSPRCAS